MLCHRTVGRSVNLTAPVAGRLKIRLFKCRSSTFPLAIKVCSPWVYRLCHRTSLANVQAVCSASAEFRRSKCLWTFELDPSQSETKRLNSSILSVSSEHLSVNFRVAFLRLSRTKGKPRGGPKGRKTVLHNFEHHPASFKSIYNVNFTFKWTARGHLSFRWNSFEQQKNLRRRCASPAGCSWKA